jgi:hypothetical protein
MLSPVLKSHAAVIRSSGIRLAALRIDTMAFLRLGIA